MSEHEDQTAEQGLMKLAEELRFELEINPTRTVRQLADIVGADEEVIEQILDEYQVHDDKTITHEGPGKGSGWTPTNEDEIEDNDQT